MYGFLSILPHRHMAEYVKASVTNTPIRKIMVEEYHLVLNCFIFSDFGNFVDFLSVIQYNGRKGGTR